MDRVVIVGAGLYGLIAAKTYLQVAGAYDNTDNHHVPGRPPDELPDCFAGPRHSIDQRLGCSLLVLDAASDIGGTWAKDRLYPNLLSQNSYGLYEFSDLPLSEVVPPEDTGAGQQFIAGWKINKYLHAWADKWKLKKHIRLNWKVNNVQRLESKDWKINISRATAPDDCFTLVCDKLILATGLTSVPNIPSMVSPQRTAKTPAPIIHAKDMGDWARARLGYQPMPGTETEAPGDVPRDLGLRSIAIYGGAKSAFDLVHFFATLHRKDSALHLTTAPEHPVELHWIIREKGTGPAWMAAPTSALPNGDVVASDKAASTRILHHLAPCSYEKPKWFAFGRAGDHDSTSLRMEGSWLARLFHGNPFGRWWIRWFWNSVDRSLIDMAQYETNDKMQLLRPNRSVISCGASIGIANQPDLWETVRSSQVKIYRSTISAISVPDMEKADASTAPATVSLSDGSSIEEVDLIVHATGYQPIVPIEFEPPSFRLLLGLSGLVGPFSHRNTDHEKLENSENGESAQVPLDSTTERHVQHWHALDREIEPKVRQSLAATGCVLDDSKPSWTRQKELLPYRLFRRMVTPSLVSEGDRSFAALGIVLTSTVAVVAEVQALWVTAFLTGGFDRPPAGSRTGESLPLQLGALSRDMLEKSVAEDAVLGALTGNGLEVDAIHYNDILMRDLGLNPHRLGGGFMRELTGVYEPSAYAGIVNEWRESRAKSPPCP